ncbi:MAG TPA: deoxyguanosinetriphosphate triphosphohydrolase [Acidiferrobacteraceae bacterium]|nr:deoxyguanosinetriphosphate triphosphohydrolase [Acidiferrobacteraceae bacterium]
MPELAPYAASDVHSRGRRYPEPAPSHRGEFQRDRDRVIHSTAFRRLEYKTQVFVNHEGDLFRTRLTHSIEVAQIGRSVARALGLNEDLTEAISLAHDLGHTPFGHSGQDALNGCMGDWGGFEHNLQSLRVVDHLEEKYAEFPGLNLTFETREGILKHCSLKNAGALGDIGARFINQKQASLEAQLANVADEIAYNNHDVDDGLRYGLISIEQLQEVALFAEQYNCVTQKYPGLDKRRHIHETIRRMINYVVINLIDHSQNLLTQSAVTHIGNVRDAGRVLIDYDTEVKEKTLALKRFLREHLYNHHRVRRMSHKATRVIEQLFNAFMDDYRILPPQYQSRIQACDKPDGKTGWARIVADYIAGMTDRYAIAEHSRLFDPPRPT